MNIERGRWIAMAGLLLLAGCEHGVYGNDPRVTDLGEANRQTMMAQVIDPDPQYEYLDPATSGEHAAQAIERYRTDKVKKPAAVRSTSVSSGGGGGGGG
ncbi:hypothetical protein RXV95_07975 [Novosphingobium sp. ZN18A2]|uniref:hypothetical protein n=1 Tax=Novosphingobium sp. ZN18A2 TaxID=3079861 RepID=UPI0030D4F9C7